MKKYILLLLALLSFSILVTAQSFDTALGQLEKIRTNKGEQSQEYLSALDSVIQYASVQNKLDTALLFRKHHLDIIKKKTGENTVEVADDLWRLGNTCNRMGDSIVAYNYYLQAFALFENIKDLEKDSVMASHYLGCVWSLFSIPSRRESTPDTFPSRFSKVSQKIYGVESCFYLNDLFLAAGDNWRLGNYDEAKDYCQQIINNPVLLDSCNYEYFGLAFRLLKKYYHDTNQNELRVQTAVKHFEKVKNANDSFLQEEIEALSYLQCAGSGDIVESIKYGKEAEKLLSECHPLIDELFQDSRYYQVIESLSLHYAILTDYKSALHYCRLCTEVLEYNGKKSSKEYYDILERLFNCAYNAGEYALVMEKATELEPLIFLYSENPNMDALMCVVYMGDVCAKTGNYKESLYYYDETMELLPQSYKGEALDDAILTILIAKAQLCVVAGMKLEAMESLTKAKHIISGLLPSSHTRSLSAFVLSLEGQLVPDFEEAMAKFDTALYINEQLILETQEQLGITDICGVNITDSSGVAHSEPIEVLLNNNSYREKKCLYLMNKGLVQYQNGAVTEAYQSFIDAASLISDLKTINSTDYITCQNNIALCQMRMGQYSDAIITLDNNKRIVTDNYGMDNLYYALSLQNFAAYYHIVGDNEIALHYQEEAAAIYKKVYGVNSEQYGQVLASIGMNYLALGNPDEAYKYLSESVSIINETGTSPAFTCYLITALAESTLLLGTTEETWDEGWGYYNRALYLTDSIYGVESIEHAELAFRLGVSMLNFEKGKYKAYERFLDAAGTLLSIGGTSNPVLIQSLIYYGLSWLEFDTPITSDYIELITYSVREYYENNFAFFASNDREVVWKKLSNIKNTIFSTRADEKNNIYLYNYSLFYKSLLLSASEKTRNAVLQSGQQHLIDKYNDIQALQRTIDEHNFKAPNENQTLGELSEQKNSMERDLIAELKALGYSADESATYYNVTKALKTSEIAIEFDNYYHLKDETNYYVALLAKSTWSAPIYVHLCTEDELKACLGNPNVTYSTDDLYRLLWQPLLEYIGDSCTVYFSPSGMLHTIAMESIHTPDGSCLSDKYNMVRLTSTRELCKTNQPKTYETGAIYGGLQYDVEQQRMAEVAAMNKTEMDQSPVFALRGEDRGNWNYLQGTKDEVEHIANIMRQVNIGYKLFEGDLGNEESFKALSGSNTDIIHLATHGYFLEGEKADMNDFMQNLSPLARQKTDSVIDPLLRSGLILSGGNYVWLGKDVPEGIEDGVLTALEISTMNLSGTDMVVMSACETGLGDITSDGVFGLQRAFKMAGVQTLVMSLWKVDDNATSLMMQTFYEHLLSGMSKREAFNLAQAVVRAKFPEPYYWAGFVMLD